MKLHPPQAIIDENDPFKNALFNRKEFSASLTELLQNVSESLVVFINAPWGEGKTTFAQMWLTELSKKNYSTIYYDAYASDYFDDPFVSFSGEILALAEKILKASGAKTERREFKKTAIEIGKRLAGVAVDVGLRAATMGAIQATHIAELKELGADVASGISKIGSDIVEEKIENYSKEKDALLKFKESLTKLASAIREEQGFPLTIVVDELDRCRPDFALGLLERIKHLFDVENVVFVLLVNIDQIESYTRKVYGPDVDARAYLLKFANLFVDLPNQASTFQSYPGNDRHTYCSILFAHYGFSGKVRNGQQLSSSLGTLCDHFSLTLRDIEKVFTILALYYGSLPGNQFTDEFLVALLSLLKVKDPSMYAKLRMGNIGVDAFFKETALDRIKKDHRTVSPEWAKNEINLHLMTEEEFEKAVKNADGSINAGSRLYSMNSSLNQYDLNRLQVIPFLCSRLDRFALQPQ